MVGVRHACQHVLIDFLEEYIMRHIKNLPLLAATLLATAALGTAHAAGQKAAGTAMAMDHTMHDHMQMKKDMPMQQPAMNMNMGKDTSMKKSMGMDKKDMHMGKDAAMMDNHMYMQPATKH